MLVGNYEQIIKLLSESSGLPISEIERRVEARRAKLSGLISREGAAQIIASELGINFEKQRMKISSLLSGMKRINLVGKIIKLNKIIEYNKNSRQGKIGSFLLADETGNIRAVLWDTNHIALIEKGEIKEGDSVEISNADIRNSELHLSGFSDIKPSQAVLENVKTQPVLQKKTLDKIQINDNLSTRAFIVQIFGPTFYTVCPECGKRVFETNECPVHGNIIPKKNAILTLILDDGTANVRAILFSEQIKKIASDNELESTENFSGKRKELLGKEILVSGNVRKSKLSENLEIFVDDIKEINIEELIKELES